MSLGFLSRSGFAGRPEKLLIRADDEVLMGLTLSGR
jgi:hypothetical protein